MGVGHPCHQFILNSLIGQVQNWQVANGLDVTAFVTLSRGQLASDKYIESMIVSR